MAMYGQGGFGAFPAFNQAQQMFGGARGVQADSDREMENMLRIARTEEQIRARQLEQADRQQAEEERKRQIGMQLAQQGQAEELRAQLPQQYQELYDVDQARALDQAFPAALTADQAVDNELAQRKFQTDSALAQQEFQTDSKLAERKFQFDRKKHALEQQGKLADRGRLKPEAKKFYMNQITKVDTEYAKDLERHQSATKSIAAGNATGDKASLVHLARMISDEALNESDISRLTSEGVLPSYFERSWNAVLGKGSLSPDTRAQVQQQIDREIGAKYQRYQVGRDYIAGTFDPEISEDDRSRVLGEQRTDPLAQRAVGPIRDPAKSTPAKIDARIRELMNKAAGG